MKPEPFDAWWEHDSAVDERNAVAFGLGSDAGKPDSQSLQPIDSPGGTAMTTTLRFYVSEMTRYAGHDNVKITLKPAYNNGKGNEAWATATPSGEIWINVNNPTAIKFYEEAMLEKTDIHITMGHVEEIKAK